VHKNGPAPSPLFQRKAPGEPHNRWDEEESNAGISQRERHRAGPGNGISTIVEKKVSLGDKEQGENCPTQNEQDPATPTAMQNAIGQGEVPPNCYPSRRNRSRAFTRRFGMAFHDRPQ
jgi:hypothetical protein